MKKIYSPYVESLLTDIRDEKTPQDEIKDALFKLGRLAGEDILGDLAIKVKVKTPMKLEYLGLKVQYPATVVISTRDDYEFFANGIANPFKQAFRGYLDFGGLRGPEALCNPNRAMSLPNLPEGLYVDLVIVAKAVIATGCTAISLAEKAKEVYKPRRLVIASAFYSEFGINDLMESLGDVDIYVMGHPDNVNKDGYLIPGIGNLDKRINAQ